VNVPPFQFLSIPHNLYPAMLQLLKIMTLRLDIVPENTKQSSDSSGSRYLTERGVHD